VAFRLPGRIAYPAIEPEPKTPTATYQEQQPYPMSSHNIPSLEDRLSHASEAKKTMLAKFKRSLDLNGPASIEKRRQREAIVAARTQRAAQRETARQQREHELAKQAVVAADMAAEAKRAASELAACEQAEHAERQATLQAEQKAARDTRYAARKAAKKVRRRGY
jgi:hypothetical protein